MSWGAALVELLLEIELYTYLELGEQRIANTSRQHHSHQERDDCFDSHDG
jgi:hypothetical protein